MKNQLKPTDSKKKSFAWGITSESIEFVRTNHLEAARDGCADCTNCMIPRKLPESQGRRRMHDKE